MFFKVRFVKLSAPSMAIFQYNKQYVNNKSIRCFSSTTCMAQNKAGFTSLCIYYSNIIYILFCNRQNRHKVKLLVGYSSDWKNTVPINRVSNITTELLSFLILLTYSQRAIDVRYHILHHNLNCAVAHRRKTIKKLFLCRYFKAKAQWYLMAAVVDSKTTIEKTQFPIGLLLYFHTPLEHPHLSSAVNTLAERQRGKRSVVPDVGSLRRVSELWGRKNGFCLEEQMFT